MDFANRLISWYLQNQRQLPWRETTDPYRIWLSEIMLQQTRVAQALPYYFSFTKTFESVSDLACAQEDQILKLWQGLGYYSRARNMHATARQIYSDFDGNFPDSYSGLLKLKGVGPYTAAAVASFSYGECVPVVDGNVFRVLSRYFGIATDIASSGARKEFTELAFELIPPDRPALFNQAIMEFGAIQCTPRNPDCTSCVFQNGCVALEKKLVSVLPVKSKKQKVSHRHFNYLVFQDPDKNTRLQKREGKGIWQNLYEFPLVETDSVAEEQDIYQSDPVAGRGHEVTLLNELPIVHKLSHQHLHIRFWQVSLTDKIENGISPQEIHEFPVPVVIGNFIEANWG